MAADGRCEVWFYHLERTPLDQVLPDLLEKTLARGWRALVRSPLVAQLDHLEAWLWTYREDSFLAHGLASEPQAQRQPILLTAEMGNPNSAQVVFLLDDAEPDDLSDIERCILIFDGKDEGAVSAARQRWTQLKTAGHNAVYWQQGDRRGWEKRG